MFNDLVFTPQVALQFEAQLRKKGECKHVGATTDRTKRSAFPTSSSSALVTIQCVYWGIPPVSQRTTTRHSGSLSFELQFGHLLYLQGLMVQAFT